METTQTQREAVETTERGVIVRGDGVEVYHQLGGFKIPQSRSSLPFLEPQDPLSMGDDGLTQYSRDGFGKQFIYTLPSRKGDGQLINQFISKEEKFPEINGLDLQVRLRKLLERDYLDPNAVLSIGEDIEEPEVVLLCKYVVGSRLRPVSLLTSTPEYNLSLHELRGRPLEGEMREVATLATDKARKDLNLDMVIGEVMKNEGRVPPILETLSTDHFKTSQQVALERYLLR